MSVETALIGGLSWDALSRERRVRRLKRGKHFRGDVRTLQRQATAAARELGCGVRTVRDDFRRTAYLWIQFADREIPLGEPCPQCGSHELLRTHEHFGRCPRCGLRLTFAPRLARDELNVQVPGVAGDAAKSRRKLERLLRQRLDAFTDVQLVRDAESSDEDQEAFYGRGQYDGEPVLMLVVYPLRDGARQSHPEDPSDDLHFVHYWPLAPFARAQELGALED